MTTTTLQIPTLAYITHIQPGQSLDCSQLNIALQINREPQPTARHQVAKLEIVPVFDNEDSLHLKCSCVGVETPFFLEYLDKRFCTFEVIDDNPHANPILQAIPSQPLYPKNNPLNLQKEVPLDPPYVCSLAETHQLLQLDIPDLPLDVINSFQAQLVQRPVLEWPTNTTNVTYRADYTLNDHERTLVVVGHRLAVMGTETQAPAGVLYRLRNRIILGFIFRSLKQLCVWGLQENRTLRTPLQTLPPGTHPVSLRALPLWHAHNDMEEHPEPLAIHNLFPQNEISPPSTPGPTPEEITTAITAAVFQAQYLSTMC